MAKKVIQSRIGQAFTTNEGCTVIVTDYKGATDVTVQFLDEHGAYKKTTWDNCRKGALKNPFHPSVHGVGYLGATSERTDTREYVLWRNMIKRCYDPISLKNDPTYQWCTVDPRWHCFSNFLEDLPHIENYELWRDNPNQGISLDKDYKCTGDKVYSLNTCCFLTRSENAKIR